MKYISMVKTLFGLSIFSSLLLAQQIDVFEQTVSISEDGSAQFTYQVNLSVIDSVRSVQIPAGYENMEITSVSLDDVDITHQTAITIDRSSPIFVINFSKPISGEHTIGIITEIHEFLDWSAAGPEEFKTYNWEVHYTNTLPASIGQCDLTVILPQGWNFHRITGSDPEFKKKQPKPPYIFAKVGDRASVSISRSPMEYMQSVGIEFAFKNEQKPNVLIWVGILLGILYLYNFRHLVLRRDAESTIDTINDKESK
ncbi:MAG: hypothetical protein H8E26_05795 [FCB group bacterium]|nr:hypothetical protein [FCB group bacterium]MBL7027580.1 hypothetical protein [Candidatus Neomarinimicrobiota bacterium]MBL7121210.1 hypothetical protein [Candidatus Neomarinimicrobiota bacterium]